MQTLAKVKRVYLSGPMSGIPDFNFPAFNDAAAKMRALGYEVFNPAENEGGRVDLPRSTYMRQDIQAVLNADLVAVLPGWQSSKGARLEVEIAREIGLAIYDYQTFKPLTVPSILDEAGQITAGARRSAYGHPLDDYTRTAKIWSAILGHEVTPFQAQLCMIGVKLSRECHAHGRDNLVDIAGYAHCVQWSHEEADRRDSAV